MKSKTAFSSEASCDVVTFLLNFAVKFGLPQPATPRARAEQPPIYLPCGATKLAVHKKMSNQLRKAVNSQSSLPHSETSGREHAQIFTCLGVKTAA